jgi:hypothetical protein
MRRWCGPQINVVTFGDGTLARIAWNAQSRDFSSDRIVSLPRKKRRGLAALFSCPDVTKLTLYLQLA